MSTQDEPEPLIRLTEARYGDGVGTPVTGGDPITVADGMFDQDGNTENSGGLSNLFVAWGQFLDHDLSLSLEGEDETLTAEGMTTPLHRSEFELDENGARVPTNAITWQVDGSQVYGSDAETTTQLRSGTGGHLRMGEDQWSDMGLLPDDHAELMESGGSCPFAAGDIRANENPALASMHTMMAREHNYWADRLAEEHPEWDDDQLFDGARQIVEYELQKITYEEWLPKLIGDAAGDDTGYDPTVNGQISVEFSTAAFRFGHTLVSSEMPRIDEAGNEIADGDMAIMDVFGDSDPIREAGIDAIIRGQAGSLAQELACKAMSTHGRYCWAILTPPHWTRPTFPSSRPMKRCKANWPGYMTACMTLIFGWVAWPKMRLPAPKWAPSSPISSLISSAAPARATKHSAILIPRWVMLSLPKCAAARSKT